MEHEFISCGPRVGCLNGGFGEECLNCCAFYKARAIAGKKGQHTTYRAYRKAVDNDNWSGKLGYIPNWADKLGHTGFEGVSYKFLLSYMSDCGLWPKTDILQVMKEIYLRPRHEFYLLTKIPSELGKSMEYARECMLRIGIDITKFNNLHIATSVGLKKSLFRIDQLNKSFKEYRKELFAKPLLEDLGDVNLGAIEAIRISAEKGQNKRDHKNIWSSNLIVQAKEQDVIVLP